MVRRRQSCCFSEPSSAADHLKIARPRAIADRSSVEHERAALVQAFAEACHELWVVGGALRDELLGRTGGDEDFATSALPEEVEALAARCRLPTSSVGKRFGTVGVQLDGRWTEITTFRGETYGATRWPEVSLGGTIASDLARRDFTMNAIAQDAVSGRARDPFGGGTDIEARLIRAVGEPAARFREDPLRILRGLRFASQLGFTVERGTLAGMTETAPLLATLSQERVTAELEKLLCGGAPAAALELLRETGALAVVLPELLPMVGCEQNRFHRFDVWGHTVATVEAIAGGEGVALRRWAALLHDLGKPATRHRKPDGEWGFYRHDAVGADMAKPLLARLGVGRKDAREVELLVRRHMDRPRVEDRRSVRRFIARSEGLWEDLVALKRADNASHTYDDHEFHDTLEAACRTVASEDAEMLRGQSPLSGDDLVAMFDRPPGPWIKPIKERLAALVLDGRLAPGDREGATRVAQRMMKREVR